MNSISIINGTLTLGARSLAAIKGGFFCDEVAIQNILEDFRLLKQGNNYAQTELYVYSDGKYVWATTASGNAYNHDIYIVAKKNKRKWLIEHLGLC